MSSLAVIRARLIAPEQVLRHFWILMAHPYSQLIQILLEYGF